MKCIDPGTLQAFIDGELDISVKKGVEQHLADCEKCCGAYEGLKRSDNFAFGRLTEYRKFYEENHMPENRKQDAAFPDERDCNSVEADPAGLAGSKGVKGSMFKYKKIAAAACIAASITLCVTVQPVRAFISDALSIFRVENVKGFSISYADMEEIRQKLQREEGDIDIDKFGRINREGFGRKTVSAGEAKDAAGFPVLLPPDAANGNIEINATEPGQISFTMKVGNVNEALRSFGAAKLLPENLDGKTFTADFAYQVDYRYNKDGSFYYITQTRAPELAVPSDVNVDELYDCLVELPVLPDDMRTRLKSIKDWKNTIYLPVVDAEPQQVDINGAKGFMAGSEEGGWGLVWYSDGTIYSLNGSADKDELLALARSMRE